MIETILENIYHLLLLGEAERVGIIDTDSYIDFVNELLEHSPYTDREDGDAECSR